MGNPRLIDLTGQRFGRWKVIEKTGNTRGGAALWQCVCDCGGTGIVTGVDLRSGKSTSCVCAKARTGRANLTTHGGTGTRLHRIWKAMNTRCTNERSAGFKNYGARGISVCNEWHSFVAFRDWALQNGYSDSLYIERKDVNGSYCPDNCTWATRLQQNVNRRFVLTNAAGEAWSQIAKRNGIPVTLMHGRHHDGWPIEMAATLPKGLRLRHPE
jgi:hypothetical protein